MILNISTLKASIALNSINLASIFFIQLAYAMYPLCLAIMDSLDIALGRIEPSVYSILSEGGRGFASMIIIQMLVTTFIATYPDIFIKVLNAGLTTMRENLIDAMGAIKKSISGALNIDRLF